MIDTSNTKLQEEMSAEQAGPSTKVQHRMKVRQEIDKIWLAESESERYIIRNKQRSKNRKREGK